MNVYAYSVWRYEYERYRAMNILSDIVYIKKYYDMRSPTYPMKTRNTSYTVLTLLSICRTKLTFNTKAEKRKRLITSKWLIKKKVIWVI